MFQNYEQTISTFEIVRQKCVQFSLNGYISRNINDFLDKSQTNQAIW